MINDGPHGEGLHQFFGQPSTQFLCTYLIQVVRVVPMSRILENLSRWNPKLAQFLIELKLGWLLEAAPKCWEIMEARDCI